MNEEKKEKNDGSESTGEDSESVPKDGSESTGEDSETLENIEVEVDLEPILKQLEKMPTVEDSEKQMEPLIESLEKISVLQEENPPSEIDITPIIERLDRLESIQVEFFNNVSIVVLLIPTVFIAVFAIKEFMDRVVKW